MAAFVAADWRSGEVLAKKLYSATTRYAHTDLAVIESRLPALRWLHFLRFESGLVSFSLSWALLLCSLCLLALAASLLH